MFIIVGLPKLVSTVIGSNAFPNATVLSFTELPSVKNITLEEGSLGKAEELVINSMFNRHDKHENSL